MSYSAIDDEPDGEAADVTIEYHMRVSETDKAVLYALKPGFAGQKTWIPKPVLRDEDSENLTLTVPRWFAEEEGLT